MATMDNLEIELSVSTQEAVKAIGSLNNALKSISSNSQKNGKAFDDLAVKINKFAKATRSAYTQVKGMADAFKTLGSVKVSGITNEIKKVEAASTKAKKNISSVSASSVDDSEYVKLSTSMNSVTSAVTLLNKASKEHSNTGQFSGLLATLEAIDPKAKMTKSQLEALKIAVADLKMAINGKIDFNIDGLAENTDETTSNIEKMEGDVIDLGNNTENLANSTDSASKAMATARQSAVAYAAALKMLKGASGLKDTESFQNLAGLTANFNPNAENTKEAVENLRTAMAMLNVEIQKTSGDKPSKTIRGIGKDAKKAGKDARQGAKGLKHFGEQIKNIIKYRIVRRILTELGTAMKEGLENLYHYSAEVKKGMDSLGASKVMDKMASVWLQLKNTLGVTLQSLINIALPAIMEIANALVTAFETINQFFAALSGSSTYTKAVLTQASAFKKENENLKALKRTLLGFDEINALNDTSDSGNDDEKDYGAMFKEVAIPENMKNFANALKGIFDDVGKTLGEIWTLLKRIWRNKLVQALMSALLESAITGVKTALRFVKQVLKAIVQLLEGDFKGALLTIGQAVAGLITGIFATVAPVMDFIANNLLGLDVKFTEMSKDFDEATQAWFDGVRDGVEDPAKQINEFWSKYASGYYGELKNINTAWAIEGGILGGIIAAYKTIKTLVGGKGGLTDSFKKKNDALGKQSEATATDAEAVTSLSKKYKKAKDRTNEWTNVLEGGLAVAMGVLSVVSIPTLIESIGTLISEGFNKAKQGVKNFSNSLSNAFSETAVKGIENFCTSTADTIKKWANDLLKNINSVASAMTGLSTSKTTSNGFSDAYQTYRQTATDYSTVMSSVSSGKTSTSTSTSTSSHPAYNQGVASTSTTTTSKDSQTSNATAKKAQSKYQELQSKSILQLGSLLKDAGYQSEVTNLSKKLKGDALKTALVNTAFVNLYTNKNKQALQATAFGQEVNKWLGLSNNSLDGIESFGWQQWSKILEMFTNLGFLFSSGTSGANGKILEFPNKVPKLSMAAKGGIFNSGDLILANEAGPELIGQMGNSTVVANNQQIVDGIKQGVFEAMATVMSQNRQTSQPVIENVFKVDSETLYRAVKRGENKYNGRFTTSMVF